MPTPSMERTPLVLRQFQQRLIGNRFATPSEVVTWLGAVQAQDYHGAKWAIGLRMRDPVDDAVEQAIDEGRILRTHLMRPTWHFVAAEDLRWLLELTAPRVNVANAYMYRQVGLDETLFSRSNRIIAKALEGGHNLTRAELGMVLAKAGIAAKGVRLTYIMMRTELDRVVCSGPRRGKQFTYALLDERAPSARRLGREEALVALASRYFTGHGPATVRDFAWWSGLTVADAKVGLESLGSGVVQEVVDGETYWSSGEAFQERSAPPPPPHHHHHEAFLLPTFDELLIGYASFGESRRGGSEGARNKLVHSSPVLLGGRIVGTWKRVVKSGSMVVHVAPFRSLRPAESEAVVAAAQRYGRFVGVRTACVIAR